MNLRRSSLIAALAVAMSAGLAYGGMMGGGMMGGGMMGGYGPRNEAPETGGPEGQAWDALSTYVRSNGLACMSCHALSARSTGPAYMEIARRFGEHATGDAELASAIHEGVAGQWPGYPPMPGGLATSKQATTLAQLILRLAR